MNQNPNYNYAGLPEHIAKKLFEVGRAYRKNELSFIEGGVYVVVENVDGQVLSYDWIKYDVSYARKILRDIVELHWKDDGYINNSYHIEDATREGTKRGEVIIRKYIKSFYIFDEIDKMFQLIWNSEDTRHPVYALIEYETNQFLRKIDLNMV